MDSLETIIKSDTMRYFKFVVFALFLFSISCCTEEFDNQIIIEDDPIIPPVTNVEADLLIQVVGPSKNGILAECMINGESYTTNEEGLLLLKSILLNKKGQTITSKSEGYVEEIRYIVPSLGAKLNLTVHMTPYEEFAEFDALEGGDFQILGSTFTVPPMSIVDKTGISYSGIANVKTKLRRNAVYVTLLYTYRHNLFIDEKEYKILENFGGYDFQLEDAEGNELFLMNGKNVKAKLEIKNVTNLSNPIADEFDVMHFEKESENWTFINTATKVGDFWETELTKFGQLIWAIPTKAQLVEVRVTDDSGVPLRNTSLYTAADNSNPTSLVQTDNDGIGRCYAPIGKPFYMQTIQHCAPVTISIQFDPIWESEETIVLDDFVQSSLAREYHYEGSLEDCSGTPLPFAVLAIDRNYYPFHIISDEDGKFEGVFLSCHSDFEARIYDPTTNKYSEIFSFEGQEEEDYDLGTLKFCE